MGIVDFIKSSSGIAEVTRIIFMRLRFYYPWNKYVMLKLRKANPVPEAMTKARDFFEANTDRINKIYSFLADDISKDTFKKLIHMRQYYDDKDIPSYNYFNQYFPKDIIELSEDEVFVDGGAFTGDTSLKFKKLCPFYRRIVAFEPDKKILIG